MADVTKAIRGYGADTREYAANTRIDIFMPQIQYAEYTRVRGAISKVISRCYPYTIVLKSKHHVAHSYQHGALCKVRCGSERQVRSVPGSRQQLNKC